MLKTLFSKPLARLPFVLLAGLFLAFPASAADTLLADKHTALGLTCAQCHKTTTPTKAAPDSQCISCHGDNDAMAKKTEKAKPNPHFNHLGDVGCTECHHGHKPSRPICADCHQFKMQMP